jgi:hypothetical protein
MTTLAKILFIAFTWIGSAQLVTAAYVSIPTESAEARAQRITQAWQMSELVRLAHIEVALAKLETMGEVR